MWVWPLRYGSNELVSATGFDECLEAAPALRVTEVGMAAAAIRVHASGGRMCAAAVAGSSAGAISGSAGGAVTACDDWVAGATRGLLRRCAGTVRGEADATVVVVVSERCVSIFARLRRAPDEGDADSTL